MLFGSLGMHANTPRNFSCCLFSSARPLSCSLLFSQQECLNSSCSLNKNASTSLCSWHLTKSLLASHQESLSLSTRLLLLTQEWVHPLALVDLVREGEGFSNLTVEIRSDGWLRFGVSSLTLTLLIKSPFNLHLTN
jgi:hypothetical protein